ncbi:MAG: type II secretion system F family protein [Burkholderiales bacterium]|nr:type II secretion system F family protein [Burkholderiales bacterium]MDE2394798.1 type II secretion system F family protein [Burkholderiales bacterium]MDE2452712.1 type II secretion system F family protein [Burkholderiales bacterium]
MSLIQMVVLLLVFVTVMASTAGLLMLLRPNEAKARLRQIVGEQREEAAPTSHWVRIIADLTRPVSQLASPEEGFENSSVRLRFLHAGIRNPAAPPAFFGIKTVLTLGLPLVGYAAVALAGGVAKGNQLLLLLLVLAALGYYGPNLVLARLSASRQREIFENFPDALDLMTVCVEAGLGTEAAMVRVAEDMQVKSPALADEMRLVNLELRAGADRQRALRNLAFRTGVDEVDGFVTMINQAERFGTSVAASLRIQSDLLRTRRRQKAEEAAAKIALKLLFPLIFCIFPSLMVVLMGPAMISIYRTLLPSMGGH